MSAITVDIRAEAMLARLKGSQDRLQGALKSIVSRLAIQVQSSVKSDKLTGQALSVRTGTLRRSINQAVTDDGSGNVTATVGTNVVYAGVHEFGFSGSVNVRAHVRKSRLGNEHAVGAFSRSVNLPERSFLRSTLKDFDGQIREDIRAAVLKAVQS